MDHANPPDLSRVLRLLLTAPLDTPGSPAPALSSEVPAAPLQPTATSATDAEDEVLVRPYVIAYESRRASQRAAPHRTLLIAPRGVTLRAEGWR
ncbi:hypothetical protein [Streptomyces sp. NPDC088785]|uniref:hypothetical protein n=1 Tax=Streptomyces sp. NPDC088785 TaxID=3365897 RepID=UPI0038083616